MEVTLSTDIKVGDYIQLKAVDHHSANWVVLDEKQILETATSITLKKKVKRRPVFSIDHLTGQKGLQKVIDAFPKHQYRVCEVI